MGEDYFHEIVHMYLNRQFKALPLREGLATFYGGSLGRDLVWHLNYLNNYLQKHPELEVNYFRNFQYLDEKNSFEINDKQRVAIVCQYRLLNNH